MTLVIPEGQGFVAVDTTTFALPKAIKVPAAQIPDLRILANGKTSTINNGVVDLGTLGGVVTVNYGNGVNLSGLEFNGTDASKVPGTVGSDYFVPADSDWAALKAAGNWAARIPFLFQRESADNYARLIALAQKIIAGGLVPILDHHGYARKMVSGTAYVLGSSQYPVSEWVGNWSTLAAKCASLGVWFDLENEPHDMPAQDGTFTSASVVSPFTSGLDGWVAENTSNVTVAENSTSGVATVTLKAGQTIARINDGASHASTIAPDATSTTLRARVRCTAAGGSTNVKAFVQVQDSSYAWQSGTSISLTDGAWHDLTFTPSSTLWAAHKGFGIEFDANGATTQATFEVDVVDIGKQSGALAAPQVWEQYSLQAVAAIRNAGATTQHILCEFYNWASIRGLATTHPTWWHTDSLVHPSGHYYVDINSSGTVGAGTYPLSYTDTETQAKSKGYSSLLDMIGKDLAAAKSWVASQPSTMPALVIGEFGIPNQTSNPNDYLQWEKAGQLVLDTFNANGWPWMGWSAGENWGSYNLSLGVPGSSPTSTWTDVFAPRIGKLTGSTASSASSTPTTVTYSSSTGWGTRPSTSNSVTWIDPTGSAPAPSGIVAGDVLISTATSGTGNANQLLTADARQFKGTWYTSGAATLDTSNGVATVTASSDVVFTGPYPATPGKRYSLAAIPQSGSTGTYLLEMQFKNAAGAGTFFYTQDAANPAAPSAGPAFITEIAPSDAVQVTAYITGNGGGAAKFMRVSFIEESA